jgi:hypothetical protein
MRRHLAWPLAAPLSVLGVLAAHALAYRLVVPDAHEREHLLASTGHGYLSYAPLFVGVSLALIVLGFGRAIVREFRGAAAGAGAPAWLVGLVPPLAFVVQELLERYLQHGWIEWSAVLEPTFVVGLALQAPFALAAALATVLLSRAAREVAGILARRPTPAPRRALPVFLPSHPDLPRVPILAVGYAGRAPPPLRR